MPKKGTKPPDSEAVKIWRDKFKYNLSPGRKKDIDLTIQDLELWKHVLDNWGYYKEGMWIKFNPFAVGHQLSEYERLEQHGKTDAYTVARDLAYERQQRARDIQDAAWRD